MTTLRLTLGFAALCAAAACPAQSMFRGDAAHSGVYPGEGPRQFHRVKWKFATGGRVAASPVIEAGVVYVGSEDGSVYAIDAATGMQRWRRPTGGPASASPAVDHGLVYVGSSDGKFYALNATTGAPKWKFPTGGEHRFEAKGLHGWQPRTQTMSDPFDMYLSSPVVANGSVYFGSGDGNVYALSAATGELRWKFPTGDVVHASPALVDGVVYIGSWDSYFYAIDASSGQQKWRFHGGEDPQTHNQVGFQSSAAVVNGIVYVGCRDSNLYAIDAASGTEKWHVNNNGSWVITSPAVSNGKVYFATSDSSLYQVVDAITGEPAQKQQAKAFMFSSPAIAGSVVLTGITNGTLEARDRTSGELLWSYQTDTSKQNPRWTLTSDGRFNTGLLYRSGWQESSIATANRMMSVGSIYSSPLIADGTVYCGSNDGNVYAID